MKLEELQKIQQLYQLKQVYRYGRVGSQKNTFQRKESAAEHVFSSLVLADFFLTQTTYTLNKLRVFELLLHHCKHIQIGFRTFCTASKSQPCQ